jgi:hypothetical protein
MMYKSYGNKKTAPNRMTRKRLRRDVFIYNKKAKKLFRKSRAKQARENRELAESV